MCTYQISVLECFVKTYLTSRKKAIVLMNTAGFQRASQAGRCWCLAIHMYVGFKEQCSLVYGNEAFTYITGILETIANWHLCITYRETKAFFTVTFSYLRKKNI